MERVNNYEENIEGEGDILIALKLLVSLQEVFDESLRRRGDELNGFILP